MTAPSSSLPPFLVVVHIEPGLDFDDPAAWAIFPAQSDEDIQTLWDMHDGRNEGTDALGVYRWDPSAPGIAEYRPGAYVPHPAWTRPRPEAGEENP